MAIVLSTLRIIAHGATLLKLIGVAAILLLNVALDARSVVAAAQPSWVAVNQTNNFGPFGYTSGIEYDGALWVFGAFQTAAIRNLTQLPVYNFSSESWSYVSTTYTTAPLARYSAGVARRTTATSDSVVVFGGRPSSSLVVSNDTGIYDLTQNIGIMPP